MEIHADLIAVPDRIHFREEFTRFQKRIICRWRSIAVQAQQFAIVDGRILRIIPQAHVHIGTPNRHQKVSVRCKQQLGGSDTAIQSFCNEDFLNIDQLVTVQSSSGQRHGLFGLAVNFDGLGVTEKHQRVIIWMQSNRHESRPKDLRVDIRYAGDSTGQQDSLADDSELSRIALGHQYVAVGAESEIKRIRQTLREGHHENLTRVSGVNQARLCEFGLEVSLRLTVNSRWNHGHQECKDDSETSGVQRFYWHVSPPLNGLKSLR